MRPATVLRSATLKHPFTFAQNLSRPLRIWHRLGVHPPRPGPIRSWLDRPLAFVSAALPFTLAVSRAAASGQWRDDMSAVRDLGLVAVDAGGNLSTFAVQALSMLPLGPRTFRAALASAAALALASLLLHHIARRMLARAGTPPWLSAMLATVATLTAAMSPSFQREATVGGGAMPAVAAALASLAVSLPIAHPDSFARPTGVRSSVRLWIALGALLGATAAENPSAAAAALCACAAAIFVRYLPFAPVRALLGVEPDQHQPGSANEWNAPLWRCISLAWTAALLVLVLLLVPLAVRPLVPRAFADIGRALNAAGYVAFDAAAIRASAFSAWIREVSLLSFGIAAAGALLSLRAPRTRVLLLPFAVLIAFDWLLPARASASLSADPRAALRLLSLSSIALCSALGVGALLRWIAAARVPMAKSASVLLLVFHTTLIALTTEEASFSTDRSEQLAAEAWTDAALLKLEPRAALLVQSPAVLWRLWAARAVRGERPDVLVVPVPLLQRGRVAKSLLSQDRALEPLLRSYALTRAPSEYALSLVADVRPLHVEFDRAWSKRIVSHLSVDGMWLEYAPQPLGPSDRRIAARSGGDPRTRVLAAISAPIVPDLPTASVVTSMLIDQSLVLSMLGDHDEASDLSDRAQALLPRETLHVGVAVHRVIGRIRRSLGAHETSRPRASK